MNLMLKIYLIGLVILVSAIILNVIATSLNISTWFSFADKLKDKGIKAIGQEKVLSLLFLFIIYPLLLGIAAYYANRFLK